MKIRIRDNNRIIWTCSDLSTIKKFKSRRIKVFESISYNIKIPVCLRYNLFDVVRPFHITTHINSQIPFYSRQLQFNSLIAFSDHFVLKFRVPGSQCFTEHFLKFKSICHFEDKSTNSSIFNSKKSLEVLSFNHLTDFYL